MRIAKQFSKNLKGITLPETLVYIALLNIVAFSFWGAYEFYQKHSIRIKNESDMAIANYEFNIFSQKNLSTAKKIERDYPSPPSENQNYCYKTSETGPKEFQSFDLSAGAHWNYTSGGTNVNGVSSVSDTRLAAGGSLTPTSSNLSDLARSLSIWFKLSDTSSSANNRTLFDYRPTAGNGYQMQVRVSSSTQIIVNLGMGWGDFTFNLSGVNLKDGEWHHIALVHGNLSQVPSDLSGNQRRLDMFVDGNLVQSNTVNGSSSSITTNQAYQITIGNSEQSKWSIGPVAFWTRAISVKSIYDLFYQPADVVVSDGFAFMSKVNASPIDVAGFRIQSTNSTNVVSTPVTDARDRPVRLFFQKVSDNSDLPHSSKDFYRIWASPEGATCPWTGSTDEDMNRLGYKKVLNNPTSQSTLCMVEKNKEPIRINTNGVGAVIECQLYDSKQTKTNFSLQTDSGFLPNRHKVMLSDQACKLPIEASDFATDESASVAFIIIDNFDSKVDLIAFDNQDFPAEMTATTADAGLNMTNDLSGVTSLVWHADQQNNVGMIRVVASQGRDKTWWTDNVFKKIKYKNKSNIYASNRKIVFALGDAWPIKVCPGLGYKAAYHFYKLQSDSGTPTQQYNNALQIKYFGMTGYLANIRCESEKDQLSKRVLGAGNTRATIGVWASRQVNTDTTSNPNFSNREGVSCTGPACTTTFQFTDPPCQRHISHVNDIGSCRTTDQGDMQWRIIGGAAVDHNVIIHTDFTLCQGNTSVAGSGAFGAGSGTFGCRGVNTVRVNHECTATNPNSPACRIQNQSGGNRQYGWWQDGEPNESGAYIYMGYDTTNIDNAWDDKFIVSRESQYLIEFGDHPWDAVMSTNSAYKTALVGYNPTSGPYSNADLDTPNVVTKSVKTIQSQYCK